MRNLILSGKRLGSFDGHEGDPGVLALNDEERDVTLRRACALCRLIVGVCLEMDSPVPRRHVTSTPSQPRSKRGDPCPWTFRLGRKVKVDARLALRSYLRGDGRPSSPTVQVLVRGHHKHQPHGTRGELRKWIHVEPYWRGPEDAPILLRAHSVGQHGGAA